LIAVALALALVSFALLVHRRIRREAAAEVQANDASLATLRPTTASGYEICRTPRPCPNSAIRKLFAGAPGRMR
jgi:hypothetical protein